MTDAPVPPQVDRVLALLDATRRHAAAPAIHDGYLDLLDDADPTGPHPGQRWMQSRTLPLIYERYWRPLGARVLMGGVGEGMRGERRIALEMLSLTGDERVLDVACGPGNFTRAFAGASGERLVVGLDASRTMLARAVRENSAAGVVYVLGDASALPFRDASFDAICCFAALYLIEHPMRALDEIARVVAPGGRVALLASCNRGPVPAAITSPLVSRVTGVRVFDRDELVDALADRGLTDVRQRVAGLAQFVGARKPLADFEVT